MNTFNNVLRGPVTSICGLLIVLATVYCVEFAHYIEWIWGGLIGVCIGMLMLFLPDKIPGILTKVVDKESEKL